MPTAMDIVIALMQELLYNGRVYPVEKLSAKQIVVSSPVQVSRTGTLPTVSPIRNIDNKVDEFVGKLRPHNENQIIIDGKMR